MIVYLVENNNANAKFMPFAEKFQLFKDSKKAIEHAKKNGYESFMPPDLKVGVKNFSSHGDVNISFVALEIQ